MTIQICKYNKVILFDSEDWNKIAPFTWTINSNGYAQSTKSRTGKHVMMHRLILGLTEGDGILSDHKNRNRLDNRKLNLRSANHEQNTRNRKPFGKSKFKGVSTKTSTYKDSIYKVIRATIYVNKKQVHLGNFDTEEAAALAYNKAASTHFGEFANLNKID